MLSLKSILIFISAIPLFIFFLTEFKEYFLMIVITIFILINLKKHEEISIIGKSIKQEEKSGKEFSKFFLVEGNYDLAEKILNQDVREMLIELKKDDGVKTDISIRNGKMYIAFERKKDLFNANLFENNRERYLKDCEIIRKIKTINDYIANILTSSEAVI